MSGPKDDKVLAELRAIRKSLDRLGPDAPQKPNFTAADGFVWLTGPDRLDPVTNINRISLDLLKGIDQVKALLLGNTKRFSDGFSANNALLWGARGMGKSSLVKAVHGEICAAAPGAIRLIEIHREDVDSLPRLMSKLRTAAERFVVFCDDLSFDGADTSYKSLKAALEGGIEGRPANVLFYATSNRRHLMPRDMMENERSTAINPSEAVEEKVSLSDRFGLWLGFHNCSQDDYLSMIDAYIAAYGLACAPDVAHAEAIEWSATRGARSGRVAWQFIQDLAGRLGQLL
jgi:hypothetical protein